MKDKNFKAGLFVFGVLILLVMITLKLSQKGFIFSGTYNLYVELDSASGMDSNTPVKIAGVDVGGVEDISLTKTNKARLTLSIQDDITLGKNVQAIVKSTGILGDSYIELYQPQPADGTIKEDETITNVTVLGDLSSVTDQVSSVAQDVKAITAQLKKLMAGDESTLTRTLLNIEKITSSLAKVTTNNENNLDAIIVNLRALAQNLNLLVARNVSNVDGSLANINDITGTIARGEGTVGRLIKDDETINKLNDSLDNLNNLLGNTNRLEVDLGMHTEYLGGTGDFKNYVSFFLKPRPDKYFLFEVVSDPDPSYSTKLEETTVTSGGTSTTLSTKTRTKELNSILLSAQIAKKFYDFTVRGGLIESSGGVGLDYNNGPFGLAFSAFDFKSDENERPHLKLMGTTNLTKNLYLLGGVDDFVNKNQDLAWFMGAGFTFTDDDIKSLLGVFSAAAGTKK